MKKRIKNKDAHLEEHVEPGIMDMIGALQQQLALVENKIDLLISQSSQKPQVSGGFSKPFRRYDRQDSGSSNQSDGFKQRNYTTAICADCKKECEVPFRPTGDRPVYCKECFGRRKGSGQFKEKYDNRDNERDFTHRRHFRKHHERDMGMPHEKKRPNFRRRKERS